MRIIDRYLLRQYLKVFLICFISLTGLYIVIDAFANLEEFLDYGEEEGSLLGVLSRYYGYRAVAFFDRVSGTLALTAALFTVTWMQHNNEMTALLAAGVPTWRVIAPLLAAAIGIGLLAGVNRELVLPNMIGVLSRNAQDLYGQKAHTMRPWLDGSTEILLRGEATLADENRIHKPNFMLPYGLDRYGRYLIAENAYYEPPTADHPGGYLLDEVREPAALLAAPSLTVEDRPIVLTPRDHSWLKGNQCFVVSEVAFHVIDGGSVWQQYAATAELIDTLHRPSLDFGADLRVTVHARFTKLPLDIVLILMGLPLVIARGDRNVFAAIGLCLAMSISFMLLTLAAHAAGAHYLIDPALAAWLPLIVSVPVAAVLSEPLWK